MEATSIDSEQDYDAALAEIERLLGAERGTPEGDKLDELVDAVEAYEELHHPIDSDAAGDTMTDEEVVRLALANVALEGLTPSPRCAQLVAEVAAGRMTADEAMAEIAKHFVAKGDG